MMHLFNYEILNYYFNFLIINIFSLVINVIFILYKIKDYDLKKLKYIILIIHFYVILSLFFGFKAINLELEYIRDVSLEIIIYNLSIIFSVIGISLFLFSFLRHDKKVLHLEAPSRLKAKKGTIKIGKILKNSRKLFSYYLSLKDLEKHMFVCGATGTGKSNFLQHFLINFNKKHDIPFFLVEFKGEYHHLQKKIEDLIILWPGENFSLNIFNPLGSNHKIHAERVFDILKSGRFLDENSEFSPQMEKVLIDILIKVCSNNKFRSWKGFEYFCDLYLQKMKNQIPMLNQTLISIKNRIRRFSTGPLKGIFEKESILSMKNIFQKKIILDLSSIIRLGGEKEDALFFLNMFLKYLWDKNLTTGAYNYEGIKHITIIEDAQYFAPNETIEKNKLTTYLEDIALLQRGTGECLITLATRPNISREILANNGIVLTFKNHIEKDLMAELINLEEEKKNYFSMLEEGSCIIRVNSIKFPFLMTIPLIKRRSLNFSEINEKNKIRLMSFENRTEIKENLKENRRIVRDKTEKNQFDEEKEELLNYINFKLNEGKRKQTSKLK